MPSLKLSKILNRDHHRPTLRERATAALQHRPIRTRTTASSEVATLAAEWRAAYAAARTVWTHAGAVRGAYYETDYPESRRPAELSVQPFDHFIHRLPEPPSFQGTERVTRYDPYGEAEVEALRGRRLLRAVTRDVRGAERQPDGRWMVPDVQAQERADEIVAVWDLWQAEIKGARAPFDLDTIEVAEDAAEKAVDAALARLIAARATSPGDLALKGQVLAEATGADDLRAWSVEEHSGDEWFRLAVSIAADAAALTVEA